jgi:uncharacterized protein (UPF0261 family)
MRPRKLGETLRNIYYHNPQVTLVRTTAEEATKIGRWIGNKLNQMNGLVRFLLPEGGFSMIGKPGGPYYDPSADAALFEAIESSVRHTDRRRIERLPYDINHPAFADALVKAFKEVTR